MSTKIDAWFFEPGNQSNWLNDDTLIEWISSVALEPSSGDLTAANAAYQDVVNLGALLFETDKTTIVGNNTDAATITVTTRLPYPDYALIAVDGLIVPIFFAPKSWGGGPYTRVAYITNLISDQPGADIVIEPISWFFDVPGGDPLVIGVTT